VILYLLCLLSFRADYGRDTKFTVSLCLLFLFSHGFSVPGLHWSAWNLAGGIASIPGRSFEILGVIPKDGKFVALNMTLGRLVGGAVWSDKRFANALVLFYSFWCIVDCVII